jgi:hypothetical protein
VHVHSEAALHGSHYGKVLKLKLYMAAGLSVLMCLHALKTRRMLNGIAATSDLARAVSTLRKFQALVTVEVIVVTGLLVVSAVMSSHEPPDAAPFLNPQVLNMSVDNQSVRVTLQPVAGTVNSVRFEIHLSEELVHSGETLVYFSLYMPAGEVSLDEAEAVRVSANSYQGEATFPVPGAWRMEIRILPPGGDVLNPASALMVPEQPLQEDVRTYLSYLSITYSSSNLITFYTGLLLIVVYGWLAWQAWHARMPQWIFVAGAVGILFGFYLVLSVALVKTYPSTYWSNPQPRTAGVVSRGQNDFLSACAECHGSTGKGDGPWAVNNRGAIPDLASPHMDVHTDGEIYWWITRGIPTLDMPPLNDELSVEARWAVVNFIRSLRHGVAER